MPTHDGKDSEIPSIGNQQAERLARFQLALAQLAEIGPIDDDELRLPFKFPNRPGL